MTSENDSAAPDRPELEELRAYFNEISALDVDSDLVRSRELGGMNFGDWQDDFHSVIAQSRRLSTLQWERLTSGRVQNVANQAGGLRSAFNDVQEFDLSLRNLEEERDSRAGAVISWSDDLLEAAVPLAGFISWESVDIDALRREMENAVNSAREAANRTLAEIQDVQTQASEALAAIRETSTEAGVSHHADTFATAASRHESSARRWVIAAVGAGVATIVAGILLVWLWESNGDISDAGVLQIVLIKAVVLSVGFYFTVTCVRLYRSNAHLAVINRHREDSLRTFRAFAEGAGEDPETKAKVLLEATHAAFGQVPTGLVAEGGGSGVIEVLDGVTGLVRRSQ